MKVNNTNLNEDLGAIEYIFSDKTGTLTQNEMKLAKWYVDGIIFDEMAEPGSLGRAIEVCCPFVKVVFILKLLF